MVTLYRVVQSPTDDHPYDFITIDTTISQLFQNAGWLVNKP